MKTILVLEDEPLVMNVIRRILKDYTLIEATTSEEALLYFVDQNQQMDLLIADLTMPRFSGIQVALFLRAKLPGLPVVLTSGYPLSGWGKRDSVDLERLGALSVTILQKPFRPEALSNPVHDLIGPPLPRITNTA